MTVAFMFPGQGSQSVGMLADLAAACPQVGEVFAEASEALGYDLWALVQSGPEERLGATEHTQPAMLAAGVAVWRAWRARAGRAPAIAAGHSLGEYAALVAAESIALRDAAALVAARGRFMQEAVPAGEGAIAALLGLDDDRVLELCRDAVADAPGRHLSAVNFNAPGQVAIAGHADAVERAIELARAAGARRAVRLPMSVPVHCALMGPARERLVERLDATAIGAPAFPVVHNADIATHDDPAAIRHALAEQLCNPVRWVECVRALRDRGAGVLIECGPGRVLAGLARRIDRDAEALAVYDPASLDAAIERVERVVPQ